MGKRYEETEGNTRYTTKQLVIILLLLLLILAGAIIFGITWVKYKQKEKSNVDYTSSSESPSESEIPSVKKEVKIFNGNDRPIAVMIDTEKAAWPQAGLADAYLLYEILIEGGESRIMAIFKGTMPENIGPIRSSRHYYLDYAMENDAIYVHLGWSPYAQRDIKKFGINNINGLYDTYYWRVEPKTSYHNVFTSMEKIKEFANKKSYKTTSDDIGVFKYSAEEINLENGIDAKNVRIKYSNLHNVSYVYNEKTKLYERSMRDIKHVDRYTKQQYTAKNIIVCYVKNALLDDPENKGRQELYDVGKGDGVYITNGKYINIKWEKDSREAKTKYYDEKGDTIILNDGITWVQIVPINNKITVN